MITIDIRDSVPDWEPYAQPKAPEGAPNVLYIVLDDVGFSRDGAVGRPDRDAEHQAPGGERPHLHELAHDRAVLADSLVAADRAQPHHQRHGLHRRGDDRLPGLQRPHPVRVRDDRRGPRRARLEHLHARQVAPLPRGRDQHGVDEAQLAGRPRLRALLRLPRRRDEPVVSRPRPRQPLRRPAVRSRGRLPPHEGPRRPGDPVHRRRQGGRAGEAVLHVLLPGRHPRAAPRAEGVDRQVQGQVRHGLRGYRELVFENQKQLGIVPDDAELSPINPYAEETSVDGKPWTPADMVRPVGLAVRGREGAVPPHGRGVRRLLSHTDHEIGRLLDYLEQSGELDNTIIVFCPTTAPPARAARTARSTRTSSSTASPTRSRRTSSTSTTSARPRRTTTTRPAGRWRSTRR